MKYLNVHILSYNIHMPTSNVLHALQQKHVTINAIIGKGVKNYITQKCNVTIYI